MKLQTKILLLISILVAIIYLTSCATYPCGSPSQVQKWERKTKFRSAMLNMDSCTKYALIQKKLSMARKY